MGEFFKQLGRGNIIQPSVGLDVDLRQPTPEQQLRLQQLKNQQAEEQKQSRAFAAAASAAQPQPKTYSIPMSGEQNFTPADALGPISGDPVSGYAMNVTRSAVPSYADMVSKLPPDLDPETRYMAMTALEKFAKPGGEPAVPADVKREQEVAAIRSLRPDLDRTQASALATTGQVPPILSAEAQAEKGAESRVRGALTTKAIVDPSTGNSADPNTASGALAIANYAEEQGAHNLAKTFETRATRLRGVREEQKRLEAEKQVPELEAGLRRAITEGKFTSEQQGEVQAVIAQLHADPEKGIISARNVLHTITQEKNTAAETERRKLAEQRRQRNETSIERTRQVTREHVQALTDRVKKGGADGNAARSEITALRGDLVATRSGIQQELRQLTDPTIKDAALGYGSAEERTAETTRLRGELGRVQEQIRTLPELRAEKGGPKIQPPPQQEKKEQLSRQDGRYKAARARGMSDQEIASKYNLQLVP